MDTRSNQSSIIHHWSFESSSYISISPVLQQLAVDDPINHPTLPARTHHIHILSAANYVHPDKVVPLNLPPPI